MRLMLLGVIFSFTIFGETAPAQASSDGGCPLQWKLDHRNRTSCNNMAIMHPGNDTRVNLMLMLRDQLPVQNNVGDGDALFHWSELGQTFYPRKTQDRSSIYNRFDHSRCQTNESGRDAFIAAVRSARRLPEGERDALIEARKTVAPECNAEDQGLDDLAKIPAIGSSAGQEFKTYLTSALDFYRGDFDAATIGFSSLARAKDKWLRETALYMIARSELNRSQAAAFGKYGFFDIEEVDPGAIANAERGFNMYLKKYPKGQYAGSAQGLLRRVYWLSQDMQKLSADYADILQPGLPGDELVDLIAEVDDKMLPGLVRTQETDDPTFLAMVLLYRMRDPDYDYFARGKLEELSLADLNKYQRVFADRPELFEYLQAAYAYYVAKDPAKVLTLIPDAARQSGFSYLQFSRQALRGIALEALGDRNARGFWRQMLNGANSQHQRAALELALAMNWERGGALNSVFADSSPVRQQAIRDILLMRTADPELLKFQASRETVGQHERNLALYTLLYKNLTRGRYAEFLEAMNLVPPDADNSGPYFGYQYEYDYGYDDDVKIPVGMFGQSMDYKDFDCPQLDETVGILAKEDRNHSARLCLADYLRLAGYDEYWLDFPAPADELGGSPSQFPGEPMSRLEVYKDIIADRSSPPDARAYALYRAVWCYGPSGNNSCGGKEVPTSQRADWFRDLKRNHAGTRWAKQLKYYW